MDIVKVQLKDRGFKGRKIWFYEMEEHKTKKIKEKKLKTDESFTPVQYDIVQEIQKMKLYFLRLTSHWLPEWETILEENPDVEKLLKNKKVEGFIGLQNIWNGCFINSVEMKEKGIVVSGSVPSVGRKRTVISTPYIDEDDTEYIDYYFEMHDLATGIFEKIVSSIDESESIADPEAFLNDFYRDKPEQLIRIKDEPKEMLESEMITILSEKGFLIMETEDVMIGMSKKGEKSKIESEADVDEVVVTEEVENIFGDDSTEKQVAEEIPQKEEESEVETENEMVVSEETQSTDQSQEGDVSTDETIVFDEEGFEEVEPEEPSEDIEIDIDAEIKFD